jgi:putative RecB family exonuclease
VDEAPVPVFLPAPVVGSLSPSRAADFKTCPLLFRFRSIDKIRPRPTRDKVRGTVVHAVLDRLFDLPAAERTPAAAAALVEPEWQRLVEAEPEVAELFPAEAGGTAEAGELVEWLGSARRMVDGYFALEDPARLEPAAREQLVETVLDLGEGGGLVLRGYVDRLDVAPTGAVRVVDYKTGRSPNPRFQDEALFQMRFYGLMLWRLRGTVPARLQLVYLGDGRTLTHDPNEAELLAIERTIEELWGTISAAARSGEFLPRRSRLCDWCSFQSMCPALGGEQPPLPEEGLAHLLTAQAAG